MSYFVVFGCFLSKDCSFLKENGEREDLGERGVGEELGRVDWEKLCLGLLCERRF